MRGRQRISKPQGWGGDWTETKLRVLEKYLNAYMTIMRGNERAKRFHTTYLDAFAGPGVRYSREQGLTHSPLFSDFEETQDYFLGSAIQALKIEKPFDEYIFIDNNQEYLAELQQRTQEYVHSRKIRFIPQDANEFIPQWCEQMGSFDRAVVFLDPYGFQVQWSTIEAIAKTKKIDLWVLVPIPFRMLPRQDTPPEKWAERLDMFFGSSEWRKRFYQPSPQPEEQQSLFSSDDPEQEEIARIERSVNLPALTDYIVDRLATVFEDTPESPKVIREPLVLRNSKNAPMYLFCFAASNPKGAETALTIARDITQKERMSGGQ